MAHIHGLQIWEDGPYVGVGGPAVVGNSLTVYGGSISFNGASTLRSGVGVPSNSLGANGDYYFRQDLGHIYFKAAGAWGVLV